VRVQLPSGPRLVAFLAVIYYAALRPEEAVNLGRDNITLPPLIWNAATGKWEEPADNWGELRFCSAAPEVGTEWTNDGTRREQRHLKSRPAGEWRRVPVPPPLTRLLRAHLETFGTGPGGRVFSGVHGGELASITYRRVWDKARRGALTSGEYASPLAKRVYDLRHACVSTWLNGGVPVGCQNSCRASELGFYPLRSCSSASFTLPRPACLHGLRCSPVATPRKTWRYWCCATSSGCYGAKPPVRCRTGPTAVSSLRWHDYCPDSCGLTGS
jgi:hypothetical protein